MKRNISILMSLVLLFTTLFSTITYADNNYDKKLEQVIIKVKDIFNISEEYDKFDSDINSYDGKTYFYLSWTKSKEGSGEISVRADSEGNILSYSKYLSTYEEHEEQKKGLPKLSYEEGVKTVLGFIKKVDPRITEEIKLIENLEPLNPNSIEYAYEFSREVDGVSYLDNTISVNVNKFTGDVTSYYSNWDREIRFPSKDGIIDETKAKELFKEKIGLKLVYKYTYDKEEPKYYLTYTTLGQKEGIDAKTGEAIYIDYYGRFDTVGMEKSTEAEDRAGLSPSEKENVEGLSGIIKLDEAEKKARDIFNIDSSFKLESNNFYSQWNNKDEYRWSLNFIKYLKDEQTEIYEVSIDGKTGELISFYRYIPFKEKLKPKYNKEDSLNIANDFVKKINPEKFEKIEYVSNDNLKDMDASYYFNYYRKSNNAYVEGDSINIDIDGTTGEIMSYNMNWYKGELPPIKDDISLDKAHEILFNDIGMELRYVTIDHYEKGRELNKEAKLCYTVKTNKPLIISGETGEILGYDGKPYKERAIIKYNDIEKSYAKDKIETLAQYGIGFQTNEFKPKDKITQKDFLYLLLKSVSPYYMVDEGNIDNGVYNRLIALGIVKANERDPKRLVTKEEGIKFIIRAMKYDKVAEINGIYKDLFKDEKDIDPKLKGYVSLGYGLKIIEGDKGYLRPKYELKREDAGNMIYNYLFNE